MKYPECYKLTFCGIMVAFMELAFAYFLLCVSAFVFIASKLLVYLPCPCSGVLGYKYSDLCVQKLLFDWPFTIILRIQKVATTSRKIIWHQEQEEKNLVDEDNKLDLMDEERLLGEARAMMELEEERAASASGFDEATAMIQRLQAEKAALEMEWIQYWRMTEEMLAGNEREINILKEMLYKINIEKHFLENELQAHKHICGTEIKDVHVDDNDERERTPLKD